MDIQSLRDTSHSGMCLRTLGVEGHTSAHLSDSVTELVGKSLEGKMLRRLSEDPEDVREKITRKNQILRKIGTSSEHLFRMIFGIFCASLVDL